MNSMQRYLAEEIGIDHADGFLSRREALRRLALLGVVGPAAAGLLAACGADESRPEPSTPAPAQSSVGGPAGPAPLATSAITFAGPDGRRLQGAWSAAKSPRGTVLVIHENKGLNDHIRSVAGRFAASGYSALAIDLLSEEGGTAKYADPAQATAALNQVQPARFVADLKAGVGELLRRVPGAKAAAVGFCFGGGMVWSLLAAGEPRLAAAVPFYGPLPDNANFGGSKNTAVLGIYGALDTRVTSTRDAAKAALDKAGVKNELVTYDNANHAFFNDTGERFVPQAAAQAYQKVMDWFGQNLG